MEYFSLFLLNCKIDLFIQALDKAPAVLRYDLGDPSLKLRIPSSCDPK